MPQIMRNGYHVGLHVFDGVISPLLEMLAIKFGTSPEKLVSRLLSVAEISLAARIADPKAARDITSFSAEFLKRENFAYMYAGGVTFAAAPMLTGMLQGMLQSVDTEKEYSMNLVNELAQQSFDYLGLLRRGVEVVTRD